MITKDKFKKLTAILLAVAMIFGTLAGFPFFQEASAADTVQVSCWYFRNSSTSMWYHYNLGSTGLSYMTGGIPKLSVDGYVAYCVDENTQAGGGTPNITEFNQSSTWSVNSEKRKLVNLALSYGFAKYIGTSWDEEHRRDPNTSDDVKRMATQLVIWLILEGWFDTSNESVMLNAYTQDMAADAIDDDVISAYNALKADIKAHPDTVPSFSSSTKENELIYDSATKKWSITLTDTNSVASKYDWDKAVEDYSYLSVSRSGNKVTFTSTKKFDTITLSAPIANSNYSAKSAVLFTSSGNVIKRWTDLGAGDGINRQDCITYEEATPDKATVKLFAEESNGDLKIVKTSPDDGKIDGISFTVKQGNTVIGTYTTNARGEILIKDLASGTYTVSETVPVGYVTQSDKTVVVEPGKTAEVNFENKLQKGSLKFTKTVEYGNLNTIRFTLTGTSDAGVPVTILARATNVSSSKKTPWIGSVYDPKTGKANEIRGTATVDAASGTFTFTGIPVGTYTLKETAVNDYYIPMEDKTVIIKADQTVDLNGVVDGTSTVENDLKRGDLKIVKTSENGAVEGITFVLTGTSQSGMYVMLEAVTDINGIAKFENVPVGTDYVIAERGAPTYFIPFDSESNVTIEWNKETTLPVKNWDKRGDLELSKTIELSKYPENNKLGGYKFRLHGISDSGEAVDEVRVTNDKGKASFKNILIGTYTIEEIDTPVRYVIPEAQEVSIHWNGKNEKGEVIRPAQAAIPAASCQFQNVLKWYAETVIKVDSEKTHAQGDSTLQGAVYGIYDGDTLVDTYTTDANGKFTTKEYECGYNWTIREIKPSPGYKLDDTIYHIGAKPDLYTAAHNTAPDITVTEDVTRGSFMILKTAGNGTGIYEFEVGAEFEVYLKSAGDYASADPDERDILTIGDDGTATTKQLPYGTYKVHQTKNWEGTALVDDFEVQVCAPDKVTGLAVDGTFRIIPINNGEFYGHVKVYKRDAETSKLIPYEGAAFQIYDPKGELIKQELLYPEHIVLDTFYTNAEGIILTPQELPFGEGYSLIEIQAPHGYVINPDPIYFDITPLNFKTEFDQYTVIEVDVEDMPQKGTIAISKEGEVFYSVTENAGRYSPVYQVSGLSGAVYKVVAAEDIYTPDGTLRYAAGEEVDRITTDENGAAATKPLYLGIYAVSEVTAPYGMILNDEVYSVELTYGGQNVEIVTEAIGFMNDRQIAAVNISKVLEQNEIYSIGMGDEITSVSFGLYADEELVAVDGTKIPKDGLIDVQFCDENGCITFRSDLPFGKYYVKEISTDPHYILDIDKYMFSFEYQGQDIKVVEITVNNGAAIENDIIYGIIGGVKLDEETNMPLKDAVIGLFSANTADFSLESAYLTAETNNEGEFRFENIPYGDYLVCEIEAPASYILNDTPVNASISENGEEINVTIVDKPIYGNIVITKVDEIDPAKRLGGAIFSLYRDTNCNGILDNDDKPVGNFFEDATEIGVYRFDGLRYGNYLVVESAAPNGYIIDEGVYAVSITENDVDYAVSNNGTDFFVNRPEPEIKTTAADKKGEKETFATEKVMLTDTVSYRNLFVGRSYTIKGVLMNKTTGEPFLVNGEQVTSDVIFVPEFSDGEVAVSFEFSGKDITADTAVVVFESLYCDGVEIAVHADIDDEGQTVKIRKPRVSTKAAVNDEFLLNSNTFIVDDALSYENLIAGREYTAKGILMDKESGEPYLSNGKSVVAETTFVTEETDGTITVKFEFIMPDDAEEVEVVVFEKLYCGGDEIAAHEDIAAKEQTVRIYSRGGGLPPHGSSNPPTGISLGTWACILSLAAVSVIAFNNGRKKRH